MATTTQRDIANQMIRQLRILDPSVSADLGTPERKLIDTFAQALADSQLDLTVLGSSLDLDSKFGAKLDQFLAIFSFARQKGAAATGVVEFSRTQASTLDIRIPIETQVAASPSLQGTLGAPQAIFLTTQDTFLKAGDTSVLIPVRAINVGAYTNVAANTITQFVGQAVSGITTITNPNPTLGGIDPESDAELKVRFKNTLFRNLAGTSDQYLALAVAGAFTNKANVIGPVSRWREYIQVPAVDDATPYDADGDGDTEAGGGSAGEYTTALSTIPYAEHTYTTLPTFISNGQHGISALFYTEGIDFTLNTGDDRDRGDAHRLFLAGRADDPADQPNQPTVTFLNIYEGDDEDVEAVRPDDIVLLEHSYISSASRNDYDRAVSNCVDVYINGANEVPATTVIPRPEAGVNLFVNDSTSRFHYDNYRRLGEPDHRPVLGNLFTPLFWNPLESLPDELVVSNVTFIKGEHYWPLIDVSENGGTVRARTGIEWNADLKGKTGADTTTYTGSRITAVADSSIEITDYTFDRNVPDLQASLEGSKQVTTDVLVHKATTRWFKFDISVMYAPGSAASDVNLSIAQTLNAYLSGQYFGATIQLSDVLQVIHNVGGVDNVRWSTEIDADLGRITETDVNGNPRLGAIVERVITGSASPAVNEIQQVYLTGGPTGGTFTLKQGSNTTAAIAYDANAAAIDSALTTAGIAPVTVTGSGTPASPWRITFDTAASQTLLTANTTLLDGEAVYNEDFFLRDNELSALPEQAAPGDTLPGLIIRPRAQHTFHRA
jgi:hypothetical protein